MSELKEQFIERYKSEAIEQQIKYGIPASVTMAQAIWESKYGTSQMIADGTNNFFGIKGYPSSGWTGPTRPYNDDKPNEPFRVYGSSKDSFEDHSKFLMADRYMSRCGKLSPTDYVGWVDGICNAGYATKKGYGNYILGEIRDYHLDQLDREAMQIATQRGVTCGYMRGRSGGSVQSTASVDNKTHLPYLTGRFAMPLDFNTPGVRVSSDYLEQRSTHKHGGIDIATNGKSLTLHGTEDNGKVVDKGFQEKGAGNWIKVEYTRSDNTKVRCTYMHLSQESQLNKGDSVNIDTVIGTTGSTGRSTGNHLHFEVEYAEPDGTYKRDHGSRVDPTRYLAELQTRSGQDIALKDKNDKGDYLAAQKASMTVDPIRGELAQKTNSEDPKKWLQQLMAQNEDLDHSKDFFSALMTQFTTSALIYMMKIKQDEEGIKELQEEQKKQETAKTEDRTVHRDMETVSAKALNQNASANYEETMRNSEGQSQSQDQSRGIV